MSTDLLGPAHEVTLPTATIRYHERGEGPPIVFVHGLLVNSSLWRGVVPGLAAAGYRCITPDWPLGSHLIPVPDADLSPPGVATLIGQFMERLDLRDVTVVANDTGGALTQLLVTTQPDRVGRVVLTNCDAFERFLPPLFSYLPSLARSRTLTWLLIQQMRVRLLHRLPIAFGWLTKRPMPAAITDEYLRPSRSSAAIRGDLRRSLRSIDRKHTLAAGELLPGVDLPVLLAWATQDRVFPADLGHRLEKALPNSTFVEIEDSYTLVPEDQPAMLSDLIASFARKHAQT
jgi:pimeloyl-ACP methyl ester carboxylesterase